MHRRANFSLLEIIIIYNNHLIPSTLKRVLRDLRKPYIIMIVETVKKSLRGIRLFGEDEAIFIKGGKMKKLKGVSALLLVILIAVLLAGGGVGGYYTYSSAKKKNAANIGTTVQKTIPATENKTADWQVYDNAKYSYQIKYPKTWYFYQNAGSPPPPAGIFLASVPEGGATGFSGYSSVEVLSLESAEETLETNGEIQNLTAQGKQKTAAVISGEPAIKFEEKSAGDIIVTYYVLYSGNTYRVGYRAQENASSEIANCQEIIKTFEFAK